MPEYVQEHEASDLSIEQIQQIVMLVNSIWPSKHETVDEMALATQKEFAGKKGIKIFAVWDEGKLVAVGETFPRVIRCGERDIEVMGLASVCVVPCQRGQGFGKGIVRGALNAVDKEQYPIALFQTAVPEFYATQFGAITVSNTFTDRTSKTPNARPWWDPHVMIYPAWQDWPADRIDLNGPGY